MPNEQFLDVTEPDNREVSCQRSLHAFFANDTKANVCFLDHGHVVAAIADTSNYFAGELLNADGNNGFLSGTAPAHAHGLRLLGHREKQLGQALIGDDDTQRCAIDHEHMS